MIKMLSIQHLGIVDAAQPNPKKSQTRMLTRHLHAVQGPAQNDLASR